MLAAPIHNPRTHFAFLLCFAFCVLSGCGTIGEKLTGTEQAQAFTAAHDWREKRFDTGNFVLTGYHPLAVARGSLLTVYIEGDGAGWISPTQPPRDPTPTAPLTLRLAEQDTSSNRLYLGRPCQYLKQKALASCDFKYWTSHRYAPNVIASLNNAIEQRKRETKAEKIILIGYSGGGALAILIADKRQDIDQIVTIAGNLDHAAWSKLHKDAPLSGSQNAADVAENVSNIRQTHILGLGDTLMPLAILESYLRKAKNVANITVVKVKGADHTCCWTTYWPMLWYEHVHGPY